MPEGERGMEIILSPRRESKGKPIELKDFIRELRAKAR
jgi:hypothetical protein